MHARNLFYQKWKTSLLSANVTAAVEEANAQCAEQVGDLQTRVNEAEASLAAVNGTKRLIY